MRFLLRVSIPVDVGNDLVRDGRLAGTMESILADVKPEAAYFTEMDGERTGIIIVDVPSAARLPAIGEPFYLALDANVEFHPCMVLEDLKAAGPDIERAARKFGGDD